MNGNIRRDDIRDSIYDYIKNRGINVHKDINDGCDGNSAIECAEQNDCSEIFPTRSIEECDINSFIEKCGHELCERFENCLEDIKNVIRERNVDDLQRFMDFSKESYILLDETYLESIPLLENISSRINCNYRFHIKEPIGLEWGFGGNPKPDDLKKYKSWTQTGLVIQKI